MSQTESTKSIKSTHEYSKILQFSTHCFPCEIQKYPKVFYTGIYITSFTDRVINIVDKPVSIEL